MSHVITVNAFATCHQRYVNLSAHHHASCLMSAETCCAPDIPALALIDTDPSNPDTGHEICVWHWQVALPFL